MSARLNENLEHLLETVRPPNLVPGPHRDRLRDDLLRSGSIPSRRLFRSTAPMAAAAAIVMLGIAAFALFARTPHALADTAEAVRAATSMVCQLTGTQSGAKLLHQTIRWKAPDKIQVNFNDHGPYSGETWWLTGKRLTIVNARNNTAVTLVNMPHIENPLRKAVMRFATRDGLIELIEESRAGSETPGPKGAGTVEIPLQTNESGVERTLVLTLDAKTRLPRQLRETGQDGMGVLFQFTWDEPLDDSTFVPVLPDGVVAREIDGAAQSFPYPILAGEGVGPARICMTTDEVIATMGKPDKILNDIAYQYFSGGLEVVTGEKGVWQIGCMQGQQGISPFLTFAGKTPEGIGIGSTEAEIVSALGEPEKRSEQGDIIALKYYTKGIGFDLQPETTNPADSTPKVTLIRITKPKPTGEGTKRRGNG